MTIVRRIDSAIDPERAFLALYKESPNAFWLDSSSPANGGRFSFMGDATGPLASTVTYDVEAHELTVQRGGETEVRDESIFAYLERELKRLRPLATDLPFDFDCGFAGYLGYEAKADCGSPNTHASPHPDAAFILADRLIAFDHELGHTYLLSLSDPATEQASETWLAATEASLSTLETSPSTLGTSLSTPGAGPSTLEAGAAMDPAGEGSPEPPRRCSAEPSPAGSTPGPEPSVSLHLARSHPQYLADIATCEHHLRAGDSYELCLTNSIATETTADPLALYMELRRVNPAPFASFLRCGDLAVLSSSPERFLSVDRQGRAEAKPIKGTSPRGASADEDTRLAARLRDDEKNRAENLMIVDLLRNDLGSVCAVGSVEVPSLMAVESYETVHQLVSTVRGRLRPGTGAVACARACFPPGSMTGAPKLRSAEILDRLEGRARGVYSGAVGYFGLGGGCDLSVTIRTIVLAGGAATIGAGGAIVLQSDPEQEWEEMLLKALAPLRAIAPGADLASISLNDPRRTADSPPPAQPTT
jgi:para-aminobenzoate synthetase